MIDIDGDPNQKPSNRLSRSSLNSWIFGLVIFLIVEICALGVVVFMWMVDSGILLR
ncbi:MAG TPA: hypothetical protein VN363_09365 [Anaerolineales bacterium]|nr:hypothetical protein [Anaerolineales bacterium]